MRALHTVPYTSGFVVAAVATLLAAAACSGETGTASPGATASPAVAEAVTTSTARAAASNDLHGGHPGPDFLVFAALHESINLTADQQKAIQALIPAQGAGPHPFDSARAASLAASIRAGQVVVTKNAPAQDEMAAHRAVASTALATLYSTLTAPQRRALVDAVEKKEAERAANDGEHHEGSGMGPGGRGPMAHLLEGIDLTAAQQQEITAKLEAARPTPPSDSERAAMRAQHESMHAAMQAKLETFAGETFDATSFVAPPAGMMKPGDHGDRFLADLAVVTSVLDVSQREKLAQKIEAGPPPHAAPPN